MPEDWSRRYNIVLNPLKSGVLEVPPRYHKAALVVGKTFRGIPVVDTYKYLGVWLNQKLSSKKHLEYLFGVKKDILNGSEGKKGKINFLVASLGPCFRDQFRLPSELVGYICAAIVPSTFSFRDSLE